MCEILESLVSAACTELEKVKLDMEENNVALLSAVVEIGRVVEDIVEIGREGTAAMDVDLVDLV